MSPEQVRGRAADARSDIFSFGAILYEMLAGRRAFQGDSAADTMSAILREDPPDLSVTNQSISPGLERIVRHCLEKNPEQRFHSAHDVAFDLESLSTASGAASASSKPRSPRRLGTALAAAAAALGLLAAGFWIGRRPAAQTASKAAESGVSRERLTFRRGNVLFARFTSDGQNVVYGASWDGRPTEVYASRVGSPQTRPLGIPGASLLAVSSTGELAILLKKENLYGLVGTGTLARVPLEGGAPRPVAEDVIAADWSPDGKSLAVLRNVGGKPVVEYPLGKRIYEAGADLLQIRVSPDGKNVAVIEGAGQKVWINVLDTAGGSRKLATDFYLVDSIAWAPSGGEIWFDGIQAPPELGIYAVSLDGKSRTIAKSLDLEIVHDIARDGTVLIEREIGTVEILGAFGGEKQERNLSWLEKSQVATLSQDGKTLLFDEVAEGGGENGSVYLRPTAGGPAVRLGDGQSFDLSPDGKWALTVAPSKDGARLVLLPTGAGEPKTVAIPGLAVYGGLFLPPDGKRLGIAAAEAGHGVRLYVVDAAGGKARPISGETVNGGAVSPDGHFAAATAADHRPTIYSIDGGEARPVPGLEPDDVPIQWSADGESLFATHYGLAPLPIDRVNLKTGKKERWKELMPADRTGFVRINRVCMTRDGASYAYSVDTVHSSDLFLVKGWK
jgi:dipeptidyl aminopeptidase/acylaminoacyl peptidase